MSEVHRIAKQLQRTFQGRAFHGPTIEEALEGISAKTAAAKTPGGAHNIWQIVLHVTFWQDTVRRWLQGEAVRPGPGDDWPEVRDKSEAAWQLALRDLRRSNEQLRDEAMLLDEARLEEPIFEGMSKVYVAVHGILQHNIYHAGQVSLLKKINSK
jgi:uncharacterized damage-inducible protein DinB